MDIGLTYGEILATLGVLGTMATGYVNIRVSISNMKVRMSESEEKIRAMVDAFEKHKEDNKDEFHALVADNKADHQLITQKIDDNHKTVMSVLMELVKK